MRQDLRLPRRALLVGLGAGLVAGVPRAASAAKAKTSEAKTTDADRAPGDDEPQSAYVTFEMQVSWSTTIALQTAMTDLLGKKVREIHLLLSSTGGDISAAVSCYNFLRSMDVELFTYNLGDVDSAAIILFLAGQKRGCSSASRFLFHQASAHVHDEDLSYGDYKDRLADLQSDVDRIKAIYAANTKIDDKKAEDLLSRQNWVDPKSAVELGVVDVVEALKVPRNAIQTVLPVPD